MANQSFRKAAIAQLSDLGYQPSTLNDAPDELLLEWLKDEEQKLLRLEKEIINGLNQPAPEALAIVHAPSDLATVPRLTAYQRIINSKALYSLIYALVFLTIAIIIPAAKAAYKGTQLLLRASYAIIRKHIYLQMGNGPRWELLESLAN